MIARLRSHVRYGVVLTILLAMGAVAAVASTGNNSAWFTAIYGPPVTPPCGPPNQPGTLGYECNYQNGYCIPNPTVTCKQFCQTVAGPEGPVNEVSCWDSVGSTW